MSEFREGDVFGPVTRDEERAALRRWLAPADPVRVYFEHLADVLDQRRDRISAARNSAAIRSQRPPAKRHRPISDRPPVRAGARRSHAQNGSHARADVRASITPTRGGPAMSTRTGVD